MLHSALTGLVAARCSPAIPAVALAAALLAPGMAQAAPSTHDAQGFAAMTDTGRVVQFADATIPGISTPTAVSGLRAGDAIVALDRAPSGQLLALGRSSAIYTLDPSTGQATQTLAPFTGSIDPNDPVTFTVAPNGATALVMTPSVDVQVDLATGAATPATALAYAPGDPHAGLTPALVADTEPDGRLVGVDVAHGDFVVQQRPGGPLTTSTAVPGALAAPTRITVASDGSAWLTTKLVGSNGRQYRQSRMVRFDPSTGKVTHAGGPYMLRELGALASVGPVSVPTAPPRATISIPRRESLRVVDARHGILARVRVSEGGQVVVSTRDPRGHAIGFGLGTRDDAGTVTVTSTSNAHGLRDLRHLIGRRVRMHISVHDFAGHTRVYDRWTQIVR